MVERVPRIRCGGRKERALCLDDEPDPRTGVEAVSILTPPVDETPGAGEAGVNKLVTVKGVAVGDDRLFSEGETEVDDSVVSELTPPGGVEHRVSLREARTVLRGLL